MWPLGDKSSKGRKGARAAGPKTAPKRPQRAAGTRSRTVATPGSRRAKVSDQSMQARLVRLWQRSALLRRTSYGAAGTLIASVCVVLLINSTIPQTVSVWLSDRVDRTFVAAGFVVEDVTVVGRNRTSLPSLREALGVERGVPILELSPREVQARLEGLPWVAEARVARLLPDTIHVVLIERDPFAIWQNNNKLTLIDREGITIDNVAIGPYAALPIVAGDGAPEHAAEILDLLRAEPTLGAKVDAAVRVGDRRWNVRLTNGVTIALPEINPGRAWSFLSDLHQDQKVLERDIEIVDLRQDSRITIRAKKSDDVTGQESRVRVIKTNGKDA